MPTFRERLQHSWNAFLGRDPTPRYGYGSGYSYRPDRNRRTIHSDRSIINTVKNRIALDVASVNVEHVKTDENGNYLETIKSGLNTALTLSANIDQTGRSFMQDVVESMFDEGVVAIVPVDTTLNPNLTGSYDIETMRVGKITEWFPMHVRVNLYNEQTGRKEDLILAKKTIAIVENPLYSVMNEPNSTAQRLIRTLNNLDIANENNASGKLDLIIQLPYVIKSQARREQAEARRKDIEMQLSGSKYGIAYTDGTERITQLNRAVENNLWTQVKELTNMLFNQLGLTQGIFDGTANSEDLLNYYNRTIDPILSAITEEMKRKFLTKTAITQGQTIKYFRDPFRLVSIADLAAIADSFVNNEVLSSNEIRAIMGYKPVDTERANSLLNKNINPLGYEEEEPEELDTDEETEDETSNSNEEDEVNAQLDEIIARLEAV